ncbi:anti-sigma factor family protein [Mycetocola saprophilus]|uniref:anti-sigma factor family protein n=1 Tax=Mycetocola saprophilus TaxID=76636 RepID=UPI0004BFFCCB|nr:zf-HC2 domain-containing protein [Mycetocola saprophilus]
MTDIHTRFDEWDAAYVLGALGPADRRAYEEHLAECERCRLHMSELASLPGLLSRITPPNERDIPEAERPAPEATEPTWEGQAQSRDGSDPASPSDANVPANAAEPFPSESDETAAHLPRPRRRRLSRRARGWTIGAAAAVLVIGAAIPLTLHVLEPKTERLTLAQVGPELAPIDAVVTLRDIPGGTRVTMDCSYTSPAAPYPGAEPVDYSLVLTDNAGRERAVSTWVAAPGSPARVEVTTTTPLEGIRSVDVRRADSPTPLLRALPAD